MKVILIVNSVAGGGRAARASTGLADALRASGADVLSWHTSAPGDGEALAFEAAGTSDGVVAVGGDGTVNEVARGLYRSSSEAQLAVAPCGSGNDFAKVLGMPRSVEAVSAAIVDSDPRRIDVGIVKVVGRAVEGAVEGLFVNAVGAGFDALVAGRTQRTRKFGGVAGYLYVALTTLLRWEYPALEITVDSEAVSPGPSLLATAGNGTCSGGGFYFTPRADPADGQLDLCVIGKPALIQIPGLAARLLRGKHLDHKSVDFRRGREITIRADDDLSVHVDGEVISDDAREVTIRIVSDALVVRAPYIK